MRYAEYLRKSRADDPGETVEATLARHREALAKCMAGYGITVGPEDVFEEVASGDSLYARPQMLRLLEAVEQGLYAGVVCMDVQRLGRGSMSDQGAILDAFKYSHTKIITPLRIYDLSDEADETYTEFETFLGRQEYKMIKRRLRRGIRATVESGGYIANAPFGYDKARVGKVPSLVPNGEEAPIVRMMYEWYEAGLGCQRIADRVNALGVKPRRSLAFSRTTVRGILQNPAYAGQVVWDRKSRIRLGRQGGKQLTVCRPETEWTVVQGVHQAIVPRELFDRVQAIFAGRARSPSFTGVIENPLAGLVSCGGCGRLMQRQADKRMGPLLLCQKRGCMASSKLGLVERQVLAGLEGCVTLRVRSQEAEGPQADNAAKALQAVEKQLATARLQEGKLHDLLEQGVYNLETFRARHQALAGRIQKLEEARQGLRPQPRAEEPVRACRVENIWDVYWRLPAARRNELLKCLVAKAVYHKEKGAKPAAFRLQVTLLPLYS